MTGPITKIREKNTELLLIFVTAVLLAFAADFLVAFIGSLEFSNSYLLLFALVFLALALLLLIKIFFSPATEIFRFRGAISFKIEGDEVKPRKILGYPFNEDF